MYPRKSWGNEKGHDRSLLAGYRMCLLTILIATEGSGIAQFRYQKREKAVSLPKISINILTFPGGGGRMGSREKRTIDISCGQN